MIYEPAASELFRCPLREAGSSAGDIWLRGIWDDWPDAYHLEPRICSHCSGAHPVDAVDLLRVGWVAVKQADGIVLQPPEYIESLVSAVVHQRSEVIPRCDPPVRVIVPHFAPRDVCAFNTLSRGCEYQRVFLLLAEHWTPEPA